MRDGAGGGMEVFMTQLKNSDSFETGRTLDSVYRIQLGSKK